MKTLIVVSVLGLTVGMCNVNALHAQNVSVNVHVNLDRQPAWGPSGYHYAAFYYFPAINVYYDIDHELFYYRRSGTWAASYYLPSKYHGYDLYSLYKVVLNDLTRPWLQNKLHRQTYARLKNDRTQIPIHRMSDHRYLKAKSNTRAWVAPRKPETDKRTAVREDNRRNDRKPVVRDSAREKNKKAVRSDKDSRQSRNTETSAARSSKRTDSSKAGTSKSVRRDSKEKAPAPDEKRTDRNSRSRSD
ncbi:MAG: hypothetical protein LBJ23_07680 [Tannerella sp.]|nr:hypothetical protein [Tannerella sp.]